MTALLSVHGLEKTFGRVVAAHNITVDVPVGQTVGIIGSNGAGKTTFINMITGHIRPTNGTIRLAEQDIVGLAPRNIVRLGISRSFQVAQIFPTLTTFENLCIAASISASAKGVLRRALAPLRTDEVTAEAEAALGLFNMTRHRDAPAATLPQGVRKVLDIAMAVAGRPRILLLDEPTSGISIEEKFELMQLVMSALKARGITVLFVEHDMDLIAGLADRVLAFYDGTVIADGLPSVTLADKRVQTLISGTNPRLPSDMEPTHA